MRRLGRPIDRARFRGIRFRLAVAMAVALLPILLLSAIQSRAAYQVEVEDRRSDLLLAAERSSATARERLSSAVVLLEALRPDATGPGCADRLEALSGRLHDYSGIRRFDAAGQRDCVGDGEAVTSVARADWFQRLRSGERSVVMRAPPGLTTEPSLLVAVRSQRPLGGFDGVVAALMPLSGLRPDAADRGLPEGSQVAITDDEGILLTTTDADAFTLTEPATRAWVERAQAENTALLFSARTVDGTNRLYAVAPLSGRDVFGMLSTPDPGLWSWAIINASATLLMPLIAWLIALLAMMYVSERIVIRWLDYLERIAALYARGRYSVRPVQAVHAPSEIRILGETLDHMAEAISTRDRSLTDSISQKDALMKEIHHRVKNNLQIISSMLSLQQRALTDPGAKAAVNDTRQRISALALIYRTLYQGNDIRHADLGVFLGELVGQLVAGETARGIVIDTSVQAEPLEIDPDRLAPVALWLVEAVSNAIKHAFADGGGKLAVRFHISGDDGIIEVEDDGPGAPTSAFKGVGVTLMTAFARQLRGEAETRSVKGKGTITVLKFPTRPLHG